MDLIGLYDAHSVPYVAPMKYSGGYVPSRESSLIPTCSEILSPYTSPSLSWLSFGSVASAVVILAVNCLIGFATRIKLLLLSNL